MTRARKNVFTRIIFDFFRVLILSRFPRRTNLGSLSRSINQFWGLSYSSADTSNIQKSRPSLYNLNIICPTDHLRMNLRTKCSSSASFTAVSLTGLKYYKLPLCKSDNIQRLRLMHIPFKLE